MASVCAATAADNQTGDERCATLLSCLQEAHATLLAAMDALETVTRQPAPDRAVYTNARWRISAASYARRLLWKECFRHLLPIVDRSTARKLELFNCEDIELLGHSAAHVSRWPAKAVEQDWPGYCMASREIRRRMRIVIEAEKLVVYPILRRQALSAEALAR